MDFLQAIASCFNKYADFSGRASRREYWFFFLFRVVTEYIAGMIDKTALQDYVHTYYIGHFAQQIGLLGIIVGIFLILPSISVACRRLHDVDRSGWWLLSALTIIGAVFPLFFWVCTKGTQGDNRFGSDPLAVKK